MKLLCSFSVFHYSRLEIRKILLHERNIFNLKGFPVEVLQGSRVLRKSEGEGIGIERLTGLAVGTVEFVRAVFAVTEQRAADGRHMCADLVRTAGQKFTLHERQSAVRRERAVARACGLGTRHAGPVQRDLLALFITAEIILDQSLGRLGSAVHDAQIPLFHLTVLDLII